MSTLPHPHRPSRLAQLCTELRSRGGDGAWLAVGACLLASLLALTMRAVLAPM